MDSNPIFGFYGVEIFTGFEAGFEYPRFRTLSLLVIGDDKQALADLETRMQNIEKMFKQANMLTEKKSRKTTDFKEVIRNHSEKIGDILQILWITSDPDVVHTFDDFTYKLGEFACCFHTWENYSCYKHFPPTLLHNN